MPFSADLLMGNANASPQLRRRQKQSSCIDPEHIAAAEAIRKSRDFTLDPCIDFFEYSCSNYRRTHVIPNWKQNLIIMDIITDKSLEMLKNLLEQISRSAEFREALNIINNLRLAKTLPLYYTNEQYQDSITASSFTHVNVISVTLNKNNVAAPDYRSKIANNIGVTKPVHPDYDSELLQRNNSSLIAANNVSTITTAAATSIITTVTTATAITSNDSKTETIASSNNDYIDRRGVAIPNPKDHSSHFFEITIKVFNTYSSDRYKDIKFVSKYRNMIAETFALVVGEIGSALWPNVTINNDIYTKMAEQVMVIESTNINLKAPNLTPAPTKISDLEQMAPGIDWNLFIHPYLIPRHALQTYFIWQSILAYSIYLDSIYQRPAFHFNGADKPDSQSPRCLNYGALGFIVGHEITHGFDNIGREVQYFLNQYSKFSVKGPDGADHKVNGKSSLSENIADNGGMRQAFVRWKKRFDLDPQMQKLNNRRIPGLENFTREQLFFIAFAQYWYSIETPAFLVNQALDKLHAPNRFRVNGVVQNSVNFVETFNCPPGTPMYLADKCAHW
ncbi:uncharacterized protein VTP21DRAFT_3373 [Calcarisporiella thermophila]|uniref:uncharacterized protein n=1 Tax=Calcarisporiella thermophila TaxID=911321 RepID=UPI003742834F